MVSAGSWRDHFKIDDGILQTFWKEFSESSPLRASEMNLETADQSVEFVLWCVREGHFSENAFIQFQSEHTEVPYVRQDFFESPVDHAFWDRVKDLHPWSQHCLPLTEWDGTLLIGSVFPTGTFKPSLRHRIVLATPTALRQFHGRLQPGQSVAIEVEAMAPAPMVEEPIEHVNEPSAKFELATSPGVPASAPETASSENVDPFAALNKELGLDTSDSDHEGELKLDDGAGDAPEGLVIPEGLSFSKDELLRLNDVASDESPSESASNVHNFETGENEVAKKDEEELELAKPSATSAPPPIVLAPAAAPVAELEVDDAAVSNFDPDATQPSAVIAPKAPAKPSAPPPVMPFSPMVTPTRPAMVKPPPPIVVPKSEESPAAVAFTTKPAANERPPSAPAEATVVVNSEDALSLAAKPARRPLFEPAAGASETSEAPTPVASAPRPSGLGGGGSAGTQTGTRGRKLESTPVTSFFGMSGNTNPGFQVRPSVNKTGVHAIAQTGRVISVSKVEPRHLDQCKTVDEAGAQALLQVCNVYETAMILLFKDGTLQPWKWNDLFLSVKGDKPDNVELQEPSIFKVVFRTAKPYHGYVVTSPVNQKFFNEFYRGMLPKHASVIPIMIDGRMGGMLLGFTNAKIDYRQSLRLMERLSFDLGRVFKTIRGGTAAKAS